MPSQPSPQLWRGRGPGGRVALVLGLVIGVPVALALGIALLGAGIVGGVVAAVAWLVGVAAAWVWFAVQRGQRLPYPFGVPTPSTRRARRIALSGLYLSLVPRTVGGTARVAGWLLGPLALLVSLVGLFLPRFRARPYVAVFTLPGILLKVVRLGRRRGLLRDGADTVRVAYDDFLAHAFPLIRDVLDWWNDPQASDDYEPTPGLVDVPGGLLGLPLGPSPDPLGQPGIAAGAMRRRSIRTLRDVLLSQREIDDLCDPDLDDRADVGVVRIVEATSADGGRRWMVQFASTKSWHPRAGAAPNDLTADLLIGAGRLPAFTTGALDALREAGIRAGEPVLLAGFSLGGMVAAQVATAAVESGIDVAHLVVAGAPVGRIAVPETVSVLALEHVLDPVPRVEGRENPLRADGRDRFLTVKAWPPLAHGFRIGALHQSTAYADTAATVETEPPDARVGALLAELAPFFRAEQRIHDRAVVRAGGLPPRPSVPLYLHSTVEEGITRGTLRQTVRRLPGVIAVDVYQSRSGFATTILWNADLLVRALDPWLIVAGRTAVYRGLLSLLTRRRAVGIHLRVQARATPGVTWEATVQRLSDGRWRESIDITVDDRADPAEVARLFPEGTAPVVVLHAPDAFEPVLDVARQR